MSHYHSQLMDEYYSIRQSEELIAESEGMGYQAETDEYWSHHPRTTFKEFLIGRKGNSE